MHVSPGSSDPEGSVPRIRVWLELGGNDGSGTVEVGQMTTINIRAILPGTVGIRIVDCAALDGLGESSQKLLDERGCPVDEQVRFNAQTTVTIINLSVDYITNTW